MALTRVFTSFDAENNTALRDLLVGQARNPDSPFEIADWSVKERLSGDWKQKVRRQIRSVDVMIVLCGEYTHVADGVSTEVQIAREERILYFLLKGHPNKRCAKPTAALDSDKMYDWTWPNLKNLIGGAR